MLCIHIYVYVCICDSTCGPGCIHERLISGDKALTEKLCKFGKCESPRIIRSLPPFTRITGWHHTAFLHGCWEYNSGRVFAASIWPIETTGHLLILLIFVGGLTVLCINTMCYDQTHPLVLLPIGLDSPNPSESNSFIFSFFNKCILNPISVLQWAWYQQSEHSIP